MGVILFLPSMNHGSPEPSKGNGSNPLARLAVTIQLV